MKQTTFFLLFMVVLVFCSQAATIATNQSDYEPGEVITVTFGDATNNDDWIGMYELATTPAVGNNLDWQYLNGSSTRAPRRVIVSGSLSFTAPSVAGNYKLVFHEDNGYAVEATVEFTVDGSDNGGGDDDDDDGGSGSDEDVSLKLLAFNTWFGGSSVSNGEGQIRDVIAAVNPDIVGFSEVSSSNWTSGMASDLAALGLQYYDGYAQGRDVSILSKYPVVASDALQSGSSVFDVDVNGTIVRVVVSHLDYRYYACYLPRGYACGGSSPYNGWGALSGGPVTNLATIEDQNLGSSRDEQVNYILNEVGNESGPVIIMGDFNEPSHEDWTSSQANLFDHNGVVYEWNTTKTLVDDGFVDSFREFYPNEVTNPGFTWPSAASGGGSTNWIGADERDRIDYIFYRGSGMYTVDAAMVGSRQYYLDGDVITVNTNTDNSDFLADNLSWPSDHKGVYAEIFIPASANARTTGPINQPTDFELAMYPNPTTDWVYLSSNTLTEAVAKVLDLSGKVLVKEELILKINAEVAVDISGLSAGSYFLQVETGAGLKTFKLIKE